MARQPKRHNGMGPIVEKKRLVAIVPCELWDALDILAQQDGRSVSAYAARILDAHVRAARAASQSAAQGTPYYSLSATPSSPALTDAL